MKVVDSSRRQNGAFAVLRHSAFRWIWLGSFASNVGNWMETVAQAWLVQQQSHSPFLVELLAAAEFIPVALLALPAGALADRHDRRKLLLIGQSAMMIMAAVLAVLTHLHYTTPAVIITRPPVIVVRKRSFSSRIFAALTIPPQFAAPDAAWRLRRSSARSEFSAASPDTPRFSRGAAPP